MGPFQNPFKRSQTASSSTHPAHLSISSPVPISTPEQHHWVPSSPVPSLSSSLSQAPVSPTFSRSTPRKRLESNGVAFDAVGPGSPGVATVSRRVSTRKARSRQPTVIDSGPAPTPRQRSFSNYIIPSSEDLRLPVSQQSYQSQGGKSSTLPVARPRIIRRASSMDNIIANTAKAQNAKSTRSKLSAARTANSCPLYNNTQEQDRLRASSPASACSSSPLSVNSTAPSSTASTPLSCAPPKKAAALLGLAYTPRQVAAGSSSRASSIMSNNHSALPTPPNSAKFRAKSANGLRMSKRPASPSVTLRNNDFFFPAPASNQIDSAALLKMSMLTGQSRHVLGEVDTSEDLTITLRGDRNAVTGLQVMLVCIAEGDETVWELRVKRPRPSTSPTSALPSPACSFTAIYTPPCEDPSMQKSCYFSAPTPAVHQNPAMLSPKANRRPSPLVMHAASANGKSPLLEATSPTRSKAPSPVPSASCPVTPKRGRFSSASAQLERDEQDGPPRQGFTNLYQGLADAYRSAHLEAEGEDGQTALLPAVPCGMVAGRVDSASPPASASSGSSSFSPGRSPEHRYALYMPHAASSASSFCTSENVLTPTEEGNEPGWNGYSSSIVSSYDGPAIACSFPGTGTKLSSSSPPTSPSALLQRRLAGKGAFNLGLGVRDVHEMFIPEAALKRLGEHRGSSSSISLKGREGWSETEPENDSESTDREESTCETESLYHQERDD